ncbi:MAG: PhoPQ-activated pathogenicity-like protein PqaA type [Chitinophagaceae bacterium]|nr:PhoPQ-activated pathogenicity-like protein PqaA type [Chitinophagaceae bacterium]
MKKFLLQFVAVLVLQSALYYSARSQSGEKITPATALQHYLHNDDTAFHWELKDTYEIGEVKAYALLLTSQKWRQFTWTHQLTLFVPKENKYDGALLFVTGGSVKEGLPNWNGRDDKFFKNISELAVKNSAIVAVLRQTPNQPLFNDLTEDALISYTLHQFKNDSDYSWPLLFPMVKSAVRAMDAVQQFSKQTLHHVVNRFVVSGASKRGWTTWLTGANDNRVAAIGPMVIDILNMSVNLDYQIKAWNEYSIQIEDYVKLGIPQGAHTESGNAINEMIDPYSYRKKLTMPKMIFMGTNDEYWVVDAIKNYYDSIPGRNMIHYVPNVGHDLGDGKSAFEGLSAFFGLTLAHHPYPACSWDITTKKKNAHLIVKTTPDILVDAVLWSATSDNMIFTKATWTGKSLGAKNKSRIKVTEAFPASGFKAFYLDLKYKNPNGGEYTESTRMFVTDKNELKLH